MKTRVITLAGSKGGVGKSTLAIALAVRATKESRKVALLDAEPQQSVTGWWRLRGQPTNPDCRGDTGDTMGDVAALKAKGFEWIVVDSPPLDMRRIGRAIEAADLVVIPARAGLFDLAGTQAAVGLCEEHGKPFLLVLNQLDTDNPEWKGLISSAVSAFKKIGPLLPKGIRMRAAYVSALNAGLTGPEHPDPKQAKGARTEIDALWNAINKGLSRGVRNGRG